MDMTPQTWPEWYDGRHINEVLFCQQFLDKHPMKCVRGRLFTVDGLIEDEGQIGNLILEEISGVLTSGLSKIVTNLLASIKLQAYSPPLSIETDRIHVANGTYFMDGSFTADKNYCNNRLTVAYNPDAPIPQKWLQFLSELLQPEDIPTLQEFLGYCLLPTTKGQKMLMLIGKGGEGKSRIGLVMRSLLGDSMNTTSIQKVESNRFSRADLENKLLMVDDDMDMSALPKTNYIKSIVTSECKMDMERKGVQSYQSQLYVRFLCFGNGALTALHDKSDGFFRRQIVLTTKDRPAGRADDPFLVDKLLREKEGIFLWCLEGLHRLIGNNYQFSISGKARENMETVKRSSNNVIEFLQSEGYIRFRADGEASSKAIYEAYTRWCDDNAQKPMSANRVSSELAQNELLYNVEATNNVHVGGKGDFSHDRYGKEAVAGTAPVRGSTGTGSGQGAQSQNAQTHSGGRDSGKGAAGSADDGAVCVGELPDTEAAAARLNPLGGLRETGGLPLFSPEGRTYSPPVKQAVVCLRHRALSEGDCGCCGSLQTMPQHLRVPLSSSAQTANSLRRAQRIGAEILYPMLPPACANLPPAALPQRWAGVLPVHFLFYERETEKRNEVNERWQFTIWKRRWSAEAQDALLWPPPLI